MEVLEKKGDTQVPAEKQAHAHNTAGKDEKQGDTQNTKGKEWKLTTSDLTADVCNTMHDTLTRQNNAEAGPNKDAKSKMNRITKCPENIGPVKKGTSSFWPISATKPKVCNVCGKSTEIFEK